MSIRFCFSVGYLSERKFSFIIFQIQNPTSLESQQDLTLEQMHTICYICSLNIFSFVVTCCLPQSCCLSPSPCHEWLSAGELESGRSCTCTSTTESRQNQDPVQPSPPCRFLVASTGRHVRAIFAIVIFLLSANNPVFFFASAAPSTASLTPAMPNPPFQPILLFIRFTIS